MKALVWMASKKESGESKMKHILFCRVTFGEQSDYS